MPAFVPVVLNAFALYVGLTTPLGTALFAASIAFSVAYGAYERRKAQRAARDAWNASLVDRMLNVRSTTAPKTIAYGHSIVGGILSYVGSFGDKKQYMYLQMLLGPGHEIAAVDDVQLGDIWLGTSNGIPAVQPYSRSAVLTATDDFTITQFPQQTFTVTKPPITRVVSAVVEYVSGGETGQIQVNVISNTTTTVTIDTSPASTFGSPVVRISYEYTQTQSFVEVQSGTGGPTQQASSLLVTGTGSEFSANDRGINAPWVAMKLTFDETAFPSGLPSVHALIRGAKVYDPRTSTTNFSCNPALCLRHYLTSPLGMNVPESEIDDSLVIAAANVCDEELAVVTYINIDAQWTNGSRTVSLQQSVLDASLLTNNFAVAPNAARVRIRSVSADKKTITLYDAYTGSTTSATSLQIVERRYECHGVVESAASHNEVRDMLTSAMAGTATYVQGQWRIYAGAYMSPVASLGDNDMLAGEITVQARPDQADVYNSVRITYADLANGGQTIVGKPATNSSLVTEDGGRQVWLDMPLPFTATGTAAYRLAVLELNRSRQALTVAAFFSMRAYRVWPGERITLSSTRYGWTNKVFRVLERTFDPSAGGVNLVLREDAATVYTAVEPISYDVAANTTLPVPWQINPPSISLSTGDAAVLITQTGAALPRILVEWTLSDDRISNGGLVEVQWRGVSESSWQSVSLAASANNYYIAGVTAGLFYVVRARARSAVGALSDWSAAQTIQAAGKTTGPQNVTGFAYAIEPFALLLTWDSVVSVDLADYEIRLGSTWSTASVINRVRSNRLQLAPMSAGTYTYWIAARDTSGNYSATPASLAVSISAPGAPVSFVATTQANGIQLSWNAPTSTSFAIEWYEVRRGATWSGATFITRTKTRVYFHETPPADTQTYWVAAIDVAGNVGAQISAQANIASPGAVQNLTAQVVVNQVIIDWDVPSAGTFAVTRYELRRGSTWSSATIVGTVDATFSILTENQSGTFTYWVAAIDLVGNYGTPLSIQAVVNAPPNFLLLTNESLPLNATLTSMFIGPTDGFLYGPNNAGTETFAQHFTTRSWTSPQDQINAGYPAYWQPSSTTGQYERVHDIGATLSQGTVTVTYSGESISGSTTITPTIDVSNTSATGPWTSVSNGGLATNFRWVRCRLSLSASGGDDLYRFTQINLRINVMQIDDSGTATANSGDTNGTLVSFNKTFVAVTSITVTPTTTSAVHAVVNFDYSTQNPTQFRVLLFNTSGARVSGDFAWIARGVR